MTGREHRGSVEERRGTQRTLERKISLILPVYSDIAKLASLLGSLESTVNLSSSSPIRECLVVNDHPEDVDFSSEVRHLLSDFTLPFRLLENESNIGFVSSVNRGLVAAHATDDILLVNSDTVVFPHWLENFTSAREELEREGVQWASITPFTNAGTIATIPVMGEEHDQFHNQHTPAAAASLCHRIFSKNALLPQIPVGVGFFMLLSRDALDKVGFFDERFSPGYGEETEWCLRAREAQFTHHLLPRVFIYHAGGNSFSERKKALLIRAGRMVTTQYPYYNKLIEQFISHPENHINHLKVAPYIKFLNCAKQKRIAVQILHQDVFQAIGGLERYVREVSESLPAELECSSLFIFPAGDGELVRYQVSLDGNQLFTLSLPTLTHFLGTLLELKLIEIESVTIQHCSTWDFVDLSTLFEFFERWVAKRNFLLHDYFAICTQHNLLWNDERFCGAPSDTSSPRCTTCRYGNEVTGHRERMLRLLSRFNHIICPSPVAYTNFSRVYPSLSEHCGIIPHYKLKSLESSSLLPAKCEKLGIVFIGATGKNKGIDHFANLIREHGDRFRWITIGVEDYFTGNPLVTHFHYDHRPAGSTKALEQILSSLEPAFVFFGSITPETFSFTYHETLAAGLPVLTTIESGNIAMMTGQLKNGRIFASFHELSLYLNTANETLLADWKTCRKRASSAMNREGLFEIYRDGESGPPLQANNSSLPELHS